MRLILLSCCVALPALLSGCATELAPLTPEMEVSMMSDLRDGRQTLVCGPKCEPAWNERARIVQTLDHAQRWSELSTLVMRIGYGNDLAYYYLGQAAQGMGYHRAAIGYYTEALALSDGSATGLRCAGSGAGTDDRCHGVRIATMAPVLIDASRRALQQQADADAPRRIAQHHRRRRHPVAVAVASGGASPVTEVSGSGVSTWLAPPPVSTSAPALQPQ